MKKLRDVIKAEFGIRGLTDGMLSTLGIVIGAHGASSIIIISAGLAGGLANGISNIFAALTAQEVRMGLHFDKIGKAMLREDFRETIVHKRMEEEVMISGIQDGIFTIIGSIFPILPYLFLPPSKAIVIAVLLCSIISFLLGVIIAKISRSAWIKLGIKMTVLALVVALISIGVERGLKTL